jgi:hypothetical protein
VPQATKKKILWKAGKWIAKMPEPFAPKSFAKVKKITRKLH